MTINAPARLGLGQYTDGNVTYPVNYTWDPTIIDRAHRTGIPPQWIKAMVEQEAHFNIQAYRYELKSRDWDWIQDPTHQYHHAREPFVRYRMGDGAELCNPTRVPGVPFGNCRFNDLDDISPRSRYRILDATTRQPREIRSTDGVVTIRQIVDADNGRYRWFPPPPPISPPVPAGRRRAVGHPDALKVPAQTTIASSYGLLQLLWCDVVGSSFGWQGINGRRNPTLFFDTPENHRIGAGSLNFGPSYAIYKWDVVNADPVDPSYDGPGNFLFDLKDMLYAYNGRRSYADEVEGRVDHYAPIPSAAIIAPLCEAQSFSAQSRDALLTAGGSAILGVAIDADDVEYQWYSGSPSSPISGETGQSLTVHSAGTYWCRAKTDCGTVLSDPIVVSNAGSPCSAPSMRVQPPAEKTVLEGMTTSFGAEVNGTGLRYQWFEGDPAGAPGSTIGAFEPHPDLAVPLMGETAPTITVQPETTTTYFLYAENTCGAVLSNVVKVTVQPCVPVTISARSNPVTITRGESTTLSVAPLGTAPHGIQWYTGTPGNAVAIEGATGPEHLATPNATTTYFASVTNRCGTVTSTPVLITVNEPCVPASIGAQSAPSTIIRGESATLSITPAGSTPRTIQWYRGTTAIDGATSATYLATPEESTTYSAIVTNACGEASSTSITIFVEDACFAPSIAAQSSSTTITRGQSTTLSITPAGSTPRTIQWYTGTLADTSSPINNAVSETLTVSPTATTSYWVRVTNGCGVASSATATVTVTQSGSGCQAPAVITSPQSTSIVTGSSVTLRVTAAGTQPLEYQWYTGISGNALYPIDGATTDELSVSPTATTRYWARVANACGFANSSSATVMVLTACAPADIIDDPVHTTIAEGSSATLSVRSTGTEPLAYQWYEGSSGDVRMPVSGARAASVTVSPAVTTSYWVRVANDCGTASSQAATVTVAPICDAAAIVTDPQSVAIVRGQSVTLDVVVAGTAPLAYQWYEATTGDVSLPAANGTGASLTVAPQATTPYWVRAANSCGTVLSRTAIVTVDDVCAGPQITNQPAGRTITSGNSAPLSVAVTGTAPLSYQWFIGPAGDTTRPVAGGTTSSINVTPTTTTTYWVRIPNACGSASSTAATIIVCDPPVVATHPQSDIIVRAGSKTLTVEAVGSAPVSYQWYMGISGDTSSPIADATSTSLFVSPDLTTSYWAQTSNSCGVANSNTAVITVVSCDGCGPGGGGGPKQQSNAPTAPKNLKASSTDGGTMALQWDEATDDVGVVTYQVWRQHGQTYQPIATMPGRAFVDRGLARGRSHRYVVTAVDGEGNVSLPSNSASAKSK